MLFIYIIISYKRDIYLNSKNNQLHFISYTLSKLEEDLLQILKKNENNYNENYCSLINLFKNRLEILHKQIILSKKSNNNQCSNNDLSVLHIII